MSKRAPAGSGAGGVRACTGCAERPSTPPRTLSSRPRSASGIRGRPDLPAPAAGCAPLAPAEAGRASAASGSTSMTRGPRPAGVAERCGAAAGGAAGSPRSRRWISAVASGSRPSRVRRATSLKSGGGGMACMCSETFGVREKGGNSGGQRVRSARAAFTAGLACKAPSTDTEAMAARARSGETSAAMEARPSTRMSSIRPDARAASRSSRV